MTSKRDEVEDQRSLHAFLSCGRKEYDDAAVQALLERNPGAALGNDRILFSALRYRPSATTIRLICDANPRAVRGDHANNGGHPLHMACRLGASLEIVRLLYERWPDAVRTKRMESYLPLHDALCTQSLDVVEFLVEVYPEALAAKTITGETPLALACMRKPSDDLLIFLIEKCPDALKSSNNIRLFPLHWACICSASKKAVELLADKYPEALRRKGGHYQCTPLHHECSRQGGRLDVVKLLIERHPDAVDERDAEQQTPLECAKSRGAPTQIIEILTALQSLARSNDDEQEIIRALNLFQDMEWPGGVAIVLDKFPAVVNKVDQSLMPRVLSMVGRRCSIDTFYSMFLENPTLAKGVVKRNVSVGQPPAKKPRK